MKRLFNPIAIIAFTSGFALMAFELVAARMLAPQIGNSTYVWTSVIGVIMIALSAGYYFGGKLADRRKRAIDVAILCFVAAALVVLVMVSHSIIIDAIVAGKADRRLQGFVAALLLFAPASIALGMTSPYLTKLNITSLKTSGQSVAMLSAINSIGSIAGTFAAGFFLFSVIGSLETLFVIVCLLVGSGWILAFKTRVVRKSIVSFLLIAVALFSLGGERVRAIDTPSATYQIHELTTTDGRTIRGLISGPNGIQSGIYLDNPDELAFWYTQQLAQVVETAPAKRSILILGGGTYTLPRFLAEKYPNASIDVVEIDPELTDIAREFFSYNDPKNITLHYDDARAFVNETTRKYDIILVDVYSDASVPFSLLTQEYGAAVKNILSDKGIVAVNAIASPIGMCKPFYDAITSTYDALSDAYYERAQVEGRPGNTIMVFGENNLSLQEYQEKYINHVVYTDNYMPAEALQQQCHQA